MTSVAPRADRASPDCIRGARGHVCGRRDVSLRHQFAAGDVYPEYSSLRTDPSGTKLLFDSLTRLPGRDRRAQLPAARRAQRQRCDLSDLGVNPGAFGDRRRGTAATRTPGTQRPSYRCRHVAAGRITPTLWRFALERAWHVKFGADSIRKHVHRLYFTRIPRLELDGARPHRPEDPRDRARFR